MSALLAAIAYSYIRFSHPSQAEGDSLRRQMDATREWCQRHGPRLDETTTLHDLGKSAFTGEHRKNPDRHALAAFLKLVELGKIPRGSYLIIENLDRLSREEERPALRLWMDLLDAGINIVQLRPETIFRHEKSDMFDIMRAIMELSRGHSESVIKSERVGEAWAQKRKRLRESGAVLTRQLPAWIEERGGKLGLIGPAAAAVRYVYELALAGYGISLILQRLNREEVPPLGRSGRWVRSYVANILSDRRAMGEFQPRRSGGEPDGEPIADYYPAVVTAEKFHAVRAAAAQRGEKRGRSGKRLNVFAGLIRNARDGDTYFLAARPGGRGRPALINAASMQGRAKRSGFPFHVFEAAVLSLLREVDPRAILGKTSGPDEVMALSGELGQVDLQIGAMLAELDERGDSPAIYRRLRAKEVRQKELAEALADARARAATPASEAWGELGSLIEALAGAADPQDARLRLRGVLRRVVEGMRLLVVRRGKDKLAALQVFFKEGAQRSYLIYHKTPRGNSTVTHQGGWQAQSFAAAALPDDLDLRKALHVRSLEKELATADLAEIFGGI